MSSSEEGRNEVGTISRDVEDGDIVVVISGPARILAVGATYMFSIDSPRILSISSFGSGEVAGTSVVIALELF